MSNRPYTQNFVAFDTKVLFGFDLPIPNSGKFFLNLKNKKPRLNVDSESLFLQHLTTEYKLVVSKQNLDILKAYRDCFRFENDPDGHNKSVTIDVVKWVDFQNSLESFFMFCWAVITSLSRELNEVYKLTDSDLYFHIIRAKLKQARPRDEITSYLNKINSENWFGYLNKSRNRVEHGQVPMYEFRYEEKVILADDQSVNHKHMTTHKNYEPIPLCTEIFNQTCKTVDYCSSSMNILLFD